MFVIPTGRLARLTRQGYAGGAPGSGDNIRRQTDADRATSDPICQTYPSDQGDDGSPLRDYKKAAPLGHGDRGERFTSFLAASGCVSPG
jgi:hypothetical protein